MQKREINFLRISEHVRAYAETFFSEETMAFDQYIPLTLIPVLGPKE